MRRNFLPVVVPILLLAIALSAEERPDKDPMKWLGSFSAAPSYAKDGDAYHNTTNNKSYVMDNHKWNILAEVSVGPQGLQGAKGDKGDPGVAGPAGQQGIQGPQGPKGDKGDQGIQGLTGAAGPAGATGPQGLKGDPGSSTTGINPGDMQYWDGSQWVIVPAGTNGQTFTFCNGKPKWGPCNDIATDIDGNVYHTVAIGTQTWMVENLKATRYNDGTSIPLVTDGALWVALTTPGFCWYNNDSAANKATYGALYNWYAVNTGKLAPAGWHVATDSEWTALTNYLGGENVAGGKLKEEGSAHWVTSNAGSTNETGFSALPGGWRRHNGTYAFIGYTGSWWAPVTSNPFSSSGRLVFYDGPLVYCVGYEMYCGFSVRCIRD